MARHKKFDSQIAVLLHAIQADREWRTLEQLALVTGITAYSIGSQLRNLRKPRYGGHVIEKRRLNDGNYEYRLAQGVPAGEIA
jgi:hypothetical protein